MKIPAPRSDGTYPADAFDRNKRVVADLTAPTASRAHRAALDKIEKTIGPALDPKARDDIILATKRFTKARVRSTWQKNHGRDAKATAKKMLALADSLEAAGDAGGARRLLDALPALDGPDDFSRWERPTPKQQPSRGRRADTDLARLVTDLRAVFERITGETATAAEKGGFAMFIQSVVSTMPKATRPEMRSIRDLLRRTVGKRGGRN
jgi:hypothetical protein